MDQANLNMRQRRWLDVLKDYDCEIHFHPGKANVVADALSRKTSGTPLWGVCLRMTIVTPLLELIRKAQVEASKSENQKGERIVGQLVATVKDSRDLLTCHERIWVPKGKQPGLSKDACRRVKAEHQWPHGRLQPLEITEWKWEHITMDFITKLPRTPRHMDTIWFIMDRLTKSAHFLPIQETFSTNELAKVYIDEIISRHGIPVSVISDRDVRFTSRFWMKFHEELGIRLHFSTAYHPQTDEQSERMIQTLEDMLRACVIDFGGSWDSHLPLAEFYNNNSYHASIGRVPFEMLYGRKCRTPICWGEVGQRVLGSTEVVLKTIELIQKVRERLLTAQSRQKSYADRRRSDLEFQVWGLYSRAIPVPPKDSRAVPVPSYCSQAFPVPSNDSQAIPVPPIGSRAVPVPSTNNHYHSNNSYNYHNRLPNIPTMEQLQSGLDAFSVLIINSEDPMHTSLDFALEQNPYLLQDPSVDGLSDYNPFIDTIDNINIEMNPEFGGGFQYQDHLQLIQRNLEGFQNPGLLVENQPLLPIETTDFGESMFILGSENQDHVQMIQNDNNTTGFEPSSSENIAGGSGSSSRHGLSRDIIAQHFSKPIEQAANDLNMGTTQLKIHCRDLGIERWPQRKLKSLQTFIDRAEKQAIIEGSQSDLTDGTKKLRQAAHKVAFKKRKIKEMEKASSGTHSQQQSLPSDTGMSSMNPDLLVSMSEWNFGGFVGDLAWLPPSYSYPQLTPYLGVPPPITESIPIPNPQEGTSQPNDDKEWSVEDLFLLLSDSPV
ncbi:hypothetical protein L2E82_35235 [Cichorium intybus]|uniref:Uncharacterized protein n=1 Tax=Cichorium intybus TaxID=13427 RepID=A0ACB9BNQ2_CICIN|nr:hypothetical protein L2E82_35235 [Cichorium intybus]